MQVRNLDTDWKDGVALLGLVAGLATERSNAAVNTNWTSRTWLNEHTVDMVLVNPADARYNCEQALQMLTVELELCTNGNGDCLVRYMHCAASLLYHTAIPHCITAVPYAYLCIELTVLISAGY